MTKIWKFHDTGEAYDACECDEDIKTGDILVAHGEGVVGVAHTWPVAVTKEHGEFHKFKNMAAIMAGEVLAMPGLLHLLPLTHKFDGFEAEHVLAAIKVAKEMGLELDDGF